MTIRLDAAQYAQLQAAAKRRGVAPERLAQEFVCASLWASARLNNASHANGHPPESATPRRDAGIAALRDLAALRARLPDSGPIDAAQIIREGRDELEHRATR